MVWSDELDREIPKRWRIGSFLDHAKIIMGQSPKSDTYNTDGIGTPLINGPVEFGNYYLLKTKWTDSSTKICMVGNLIVCVRGSTTGRFVKSDGEYCLGTTPVTGGGFSWSASDLDLALSGPVAEVVFDDSGKADIQPLLAGLAETDFEKERDE